MIVSLKSAWGCAALCLLMAGGGGWLLLERKSQVRPVLTIGFGEFAPYQVHRPDGSADGFAVQMVKEAARRIGQPLQWKRFKPSPEVALQTGEIQLFPMMAMLPDRLGKVDFSPAWWENALVVVSPAGAPVVSRQSAAGKKVSLIHATFGLQRMKSLFPEAIAVPSRDYRQVVSGVCKGEVAAAIMETRLANALQFLDECRSQQLTVKWFPELNLRYAVAARKGLGPVANELFEEMMRMSLDGSMTRIGEPWGVSTSNQHNSVARLAEAQGQTRYSLVGSAIIGTFCVALILVALRLRRATRIAESALAAQGRFIANVSHEIRTPLHGILGITGLLSESSLDPGQRGHLQILEDCSGLLLRQINDLLDMAKLEAGKLSLESIAYSPAEIVRTTLQIHEAQAKQKGIHLSASIAFSGRILGDPFRLQQILNNLVSNAFKFTDHGSIRIEVAPRGGFLRFAVRDTGFGLSAEARAKLFQPFVQADTSTARRFGGTGLGLTICRQLVGLMGGSMGLHSEVGQGSEFWFELPLVVAPSAPQFTAPQFTGPLVSGPLVSEAALRPWAAHVLVAEDNPVNQRIVSAALEKLGCTVVLVEHGNGAVAAAQEGSFDLILMDCHMPEMDGFEATRSIRALAGAVARTPIIAVTAAAMEADTRRAKEAGMDDFLSKPFTRDQLSAILTRWSGRQR